MRRQIKRKEEEISALLNNFEESKKSRKQWCLEHGIPTSSLHTWLKKYRTPNEEIKVNFVPIKLDPPPPARESSPSYNNQIMIEIGDIKIHIYDSASCESIKMVIEVVKSVYV